MQKNIAVHLILQGDELGTRAYLIFDAYLTHSTGDRNLIEPSRHRQNLAEKEPVGTSSGGASHRLRRGCPRIMSSPAFGSSGHGYVGVTNELLTIIGPL